MMGSLDRRTFLSSAAATVAAISVAPAPRIRSRGGNSRCSRSRWPSGRCTSSVRQQDGQPRLPRRAKRDFGIDAVEYVNQFFKDKAKDTAYLTELKKRATTTASRAC